MKPWDEQREASWWQSRRGRVSTRTGVILKGRKDLLFMGYRQFGDLTAGATYGQLQWLAIVGRMPTPSEERLMDAMAAVTSYGDPRLWFLSTARWAASARAPVGAAMSAAVSVLDSRVFGGYATYLISKYFQRSVKRMDSGGLTVEQLVDESLSRHEAIPGYGRPLVRKDERVAILLELHARLGFQRGPHLQLALRLQDELLRRKDLILNCGGLDSVFLSDLGLSPRQINLLAQTMFLPSIYAAMAEGYDKEPADLLPQACEDIDYCGPAERRLPVSSPAGSRSRKG